MPAGRTVSDKERAEIRKDYRECLNSFDRTSLLSTWYNFPYNDNVKMKKAVLAAANISDKQLIKLILDRDVNDTVESLRKGF